MSSTHFLDEETEPQRTVACIRGEQGLRPPSAQSLPQTGHGARVQGDTQWIRLPLQSYDTVSSFGNVRKVHFSTLKALRSASVKKKEYLPGWGHSDNVF